MLLCAFCRRQSAGIGRPTISRCYFLRIVEIYDDASSNQPFIGRFFPTTSRRVWEKSTDRRSNDHRPADKSVVHRSFSTSQNAYVGVTVH